MQKGVYVETTYIEYGDIWVGQKQKHFFENIINNILEAAVINVILQNNRKYKLRTIMFHSMFKNCQLIVSIPEQNTKCIS